MKNDKGMIKGAAKPTFTPVGAILPEALYRRDELLARMGWRDASFREALRNGLKAYKCGKRIFILGRDVIDFVTSGKVVSSVRVKVLTHKTEELT